MRYIELKLRRLTGMEREKIEEELAELLKLIQNYREILASEEKILGIIKEEMLEIKEKYADDRKTKIDNTAIEFIEDESLIPVENVILTITHNNYIKRVTTDNYKTQHRGGVGIRGMTTNEEDFVEQVINVGTHDFILFFSDKGKVYRIKGYEIPEYSRTSKGLPIVNLLQVDKDEKIKTALKLTSDEDYKYLLFATKNGVVKRTSIEEFDNIRKSGKIAISLKDDDELIAVKKTTGSNKVFMCSSNGRMVCFDENNIRVMGRTASGVRGMNLSNDVCVGAEIADNTNDILVVTEKGYGKKTDMNEYRETKRGSKGVKTLNVTSKNGKIVGFKSTTDESDAMIITNNGMVIRLAISGISKMGRVTQGVRLINLKEDNLVTSISIVSKDKENEADDFEDENDTSILEQ